MRDVKNLLKRVSFYHADKVKRNSFPFDCGLHTLGMQKGDNESDVEFVERFLVKYFNGCKNRGGKEYRKFYLTVEEGDNYSTVWGVKNK